jgi:hypothetical protein
MSCVAGSICFELLRGVPAAVVALLVGGIAAGIAYRQYGVARARLKLDLFEKRFAIFHKTWEILSEVVMKGTREKNYGLATPFNNFLPEAQFLFGEPIKKYLDEVSSRWTRLYGLEAERGEEGIDRHANISEARELKCWFHEQASTGVKAQFDPYLNFENWR